MIDKEIAKEVKKIRNILLHSEIRDIDITLGMLMYKWLCESKEQFGWLVDKEDHFNLLSSYDEDIKSVLINSVNNIENQNEYLKGVFTDKLFRNLDRVSVKDLKPIIMQLTLLNVESDDRGIEITSSVIEEVYSSFAAMELEMSAKSVNRLSAVILKPNSGRVMDWFFGIGDGITQIQNYLQNKGVIDGTVSFSGQELSIDTYYYAKIYCLLHGLTGVDLRHGDSLLGPQFLMKGKLEKFDYITSTPPFGVRNWRHDEVLNDSLNRFTLGIPNRNSFDWASIQHILASLSDTGKASVIVPGGTLFRTSENNLREQLIKSDMLETVIALPDNMMSYTSMPTYMLILNKQKPLLKKGKVQFIDSISHYVKSKRLKTLSDDIIKKIDSAYESSENVLEFSFFLTIGELEAYNWNLDAIRYIEVESLKEDLSDMVTLSSVTSRVRRGVQLSKEKLNEIANSGNKSHYLINLANVTDKGITYDELNLIDPEEKWIDLYELKKGDIIITSRATTVKMAIVTEDIPAIISSNLILVRVNDSLYNSEFLKLYLESPLGSKLISGLASGSKLIVITPKNLSELLVPDFAISESNSIIKEFNSVNDENLRIIEEAEKNILVALEGMYRNMGVLNK